MVIFHNDLRVGALSNWNLDNSLDSKITVLMRRITWISSTKGFLNLLISELRGLPDNRNWLNDGLGRRRRGSSVHYLGLNLLLCQRVG